jgi:hypothetical protein
MELVNPHNDGFSQLGYLKKLIEVKILIDAIDFKKELIRFSSIDTKQLELDLNLQEPIKLNLHNYKWWKEEETALDDF